MAWQTAPNDANYGALQLEFCSVLWRPSGGDSTAGENRALTSVTTGDGDALWRLYLVEGIVIAALIFLSKDWGAPGETLDWIFRAEQWRHYRCRFPSRGLHFGACGRRRVLVVEWCFIYRIVDDESRRRSTSDYRRQTHFDGRVQGGGAGVVATLMTGLVRVFASSYT